jgi:type I restriction-modification system DNA methylase subunit
MLPAKQTKLMPAHKKVPKKQAVPKNKSLESWIWDAACSIRGAKGLKKNDYNISPSRYIHTSDAETYRPIAEIVEELEAIEAEARETDKALRGILKRIGVSA